MVSLDDAPEGRKYPPSVRHQVCFVLPKSDEVQLSTTKEAFKAPFLEKGEFHLTLKWEGVGQKLLRLHRKVNFTGEVMVLVGEYCGPEHYAIALLEAARGKSALSPALYGFLGTHCADLQLANCAVVPFQGMLVKDVEYALRKGISSWTRTSASVWRESRTICPAAWCFAPWREPGSRRLSRASCSRNS